ncbi:hypothetical protein CEP51_008016 [Fusarium floridanum]|uniref:Heterokaryon incompatibility domain-containing protein n=1 Tax=Fusarium floridanum TaxID=1325733 RepID=A0A428RM98_9HYPO|nr:hypothetical protein CEP51_008016 [Fusarium floridanum]
MPETTLPNRKRQRTDEPVSERRCVVCAGLFTSKGLQELQSEDGYEHRTREKAEESAKEGCTLCAFLVRLGKNKFGVDKWLAGHHLVFRSQRQSDNQTPLLTILRGTIKRSNEILTIYPFAKSGDPLATLIPRRPVKRDVKSEAVFAAARKLINACLSPDNPREGHKLCRYSRDTVLPTRVLDVGDPKDRDPQLKLQVNEVETHGSYLALSYCWGAPGPRTAPKPLLLRRDSLHRLTSKIRPNKLQQSIQDAIWVTRELGFRYLWIDALCIIQDDKEDKAHEISKMATIYKNASITLAAGTATKASEGFLGNIPSRPNVYLPENKFAIPLRNGAEIGTVYLSAEAYEADHPLDERGWTLQEYMLSSRMLIFSDYQLLWQCKKVPLRSVTGNNRGLEYRQHLESVPWTVFDEEAEPYFGTDDSEKLYIWKTIILQYTERNLTNADDRLPAVSGITMELEKLWRDSNIWGLWKRWFISLLAWYKVDMDRVGKRNLKRAPSWSWVSLDGRIHYKGPLEDEDAKVKTLSMKQVVLSCRILDIDEVEADVIENDDIEVLFDNGPQSVIEWPDLDHSAWREELGQKDLLYLLLGTLADDSSEGRGLGLLVIEVAKGRYRRIGLAVFNDMSIWEGVERRTIEFEPKQ